MLDSRFTEDFSKKENYADSEDRLFGDVLNGITDHDFVFAKVSLIETCHKHSPMEKANSGFESQMEKLDSFVNTLYSSLASRSLIVLFTGNGNTSEFLNLLNKKNAYQTLFRTKPISQMTDDELWTETDQLKLENASSIAKMGAVMVKLKP